MSFFKQFLEEEIRDVLFHYTSVRSAKNILNAKSLVLTTPLGTGSDNIGSSKAFYLSLTRSKVGGYTLSSAGGTTAVVINFQRNWLRNNFTIEPVDYWGREFRKVKPTSNEMEERLWSDRQHIKLPSPLSKAIESIHIHINIKRDFDDREKIVLRKVLLEAKKYGVEVFLYDNLNYWLLQQRHKAIPIGQMLDYIKGHIKGHANVGMIYPRPKFINAWVELYKKPVNQPLSDKARYNAKLVQRWTWETEGLRSLINDIHNDKHHPEIEKLVLLIRKHGSPKDFLKVLHDKWNNVV